MKPPRTLRTIHNGSHDTAKAYLSIPAGASLTVPAEVADQAQRDAAFKDGEAPEALLSALYPEDDPAPEAAPKPKATKAPAKAAPKPKPADEVEG